MQDIPKQISTRLWKRSGKIPRIVVDTNLFVSGLLNPYSGKPARLIDLLPLRRKRYQLLISRKTFEEYKAVINRFEQISRTKRKKLLGKIRAHSNWVSPKEKFAVIKDDPKDNKFLECAVAGKANFLISGDKHLLSLKEFQGVKIITIEEWFV